MKLERLREQADGYVEKFRKAVQWYHQHRRWFALSEELIQTLYYARDGGPISIAAASANMAVSVVDAVFPETTLEEKLRLRGYHYVRCAVDRLLCELLESSGTPSTVLAEGGACAKLWEHNGTGAAIIYFEEDRPYGPFVLGGDETFLLDVVARGVWAQGSDIMLTAKTEGRGFDLVPIPEPGPYVGEPSPEYFAERLIRYGDRPRTLLLNGPTGVGKSVLARRVASLASHGTSRTLKVSSHVLKGFGAAELRDLARYVQPTVLLLDDLNVVGSHYEDEDESVLGPLLDLLETLRVEGCLVIITHMVATHRGNPVYRGDSYVEGMRPGRLDEIVFLYPPEEKDRELILRYYYGACGVEPTEKQHAHIVKTTEGLTGAYLREVVERLAVHGLGRMDQEIEDVLRAAPPLPRVLTSVRGRLRRRASRNTPSLKERAAKRLEKRADKCVPYAEKEAEKMRMRAERLRESAEKQRLREVEKKAKKAAKKKRRKK